MRIVRCPTRVSLWGGGCDHPSYYSHHGATIISFAIDEYMHVIWNPRPTGGCRLSWSVVEEVSSLTNVQHTLVRACAERYGFQEPCTLSIISDVPKGTGLGSSSALAVCLCKLLNVHWIVPSAMYLEQEVSPNVGLQDSLPADYGGFRIYRIAEYGLLPPVQDSQCVPQNAVDIINTHGMLLYTGATREANPILGNWRDNTETLHRIRELAERMAACVDEWTPRTLGDALIEGWNLKRSIEGVSNDALDLQYAKMMAAGAYGGKLCGAGAGGAWFLLVPPSKRQDVLEASEMIEIPFKVAEHGVEEWSL